MNTNLRFSDVGTNTLQQEEADDELNHLIAAFFPAIAELPRVPRQTRSREKRKELLKTAARLFAEKGYTLTTADEIAAEAKVSVGTFYSYFKNKRQILLVLVWNQLDSIFSSLALARLDFRGDNLRGVICSAVTSVINHEQNALRRVWFELVAREPELIPYQGLIRRYSLTRLTQNLQQITNLEHTWPEIDVEAMAFSILTLLESLSLNNTQDLPDERIIACITDMIYHSIFMVNSLPVAEKI
jgi:TetR/AcrR family transcriptional regulator, mexJK operon transcriptional repressor